MAEQPEVSLHFTDYWRVIKNRWPIVITVFILVVASAYFYSQSLDKIYGASAVVKVDRVNPDLNVFQQTQEGFDAIFFQTEFELIQSRKVLDRVIEQMSLRSRWGERYSAPNGVLDTQQAYNMLRGRHLQARPYRNTKLIEILAFSTDPQEAADIANTVAQQYEIYRLDEIRSRSESGLTTLKEEVEKQQEVVMRARNRVEELRRDLQLDLTPGSAAGNIATLQEIELQRKEAMLTEARADAMSRKVRLERVRNLTIEELESALPTLGLEDSTVTQLKQSYLATQTSIEQMRRQGLQEEHPRMRSAAATLIQYRDQLNTLIAGIRTALEIDLTVSETRVDSLQAEVTALRARTRGAKSEQLAPYEEAQRELETQQSLFTIMASRFQQQSVDAQINVRPVTLINPAEVSPNPAPVRPNVKLNVILAAVVGLVLGVSLAFFIEYLDTSVKSLDDVERYLEVSVVGVVPEGVNYLNLEGPESPNAEAYRILRAKIDLQSKADGAHTLTVVSGGPGEGKSTTLFNLGYVCAYSGINTLIIDTDFRRSTINAALAISNEPGLADFLMGYGQLHEYIRNTDIPNLQVITAGKLPPQCMGALNPAKMHEIIQTLKPHYEVILFDAPPILGISDAAVIVHEVDTTLLAIQHRRYPRNISWRAKKVIEEVGGRLGGVVLNKVHLRSDESYYYYTSYYSYHGYYTSKDRKQTQKKAKENQKELAKRQKQIAQQRSESSHAEDY